MGFMSPELPDVDPETWPHAAPGNATANRHPALGGARLRNALCGVSALPDQDRACTSPLPAAIISLTPGLGGLGHIADWWTQPIVYQKVIIFTLLFEVLGLAADPAR